MTDLSKKLEARRDSLPPSSEYRAMLDALLAAEAFRVADEAYAAHHPRCEDLGSAVIDTRAALFAALDRAEAEAAR